MQKIPKADMPKYQIKTKNNIMTWLLGGSSPRTVFKAKKIIVFYFLFFHSNEETKRKDKKTKDKTINK